MKKQKLSVGADDSTVYTDSVRSKASTEIMHVCPKHQRNNQRGITLIALIITIIVLLILAVVSIRLVVNNGILGKAEHAVNKYQEEEIEEQIKLAYAEWQTAQFTGETRTAAEFMQAKLREILSDNNLTVTEDNGEFTVTLSDETYYEYIKSTGAVVKKVFIKKSTKKEDSYVGYYADIDEDGTVDGVIFVDLLTGSVRDTQQWTNNHGAYILPTYFSVDDVNSYYISQSSYTDPLFKTTHPVISPKTTNGKQRFYIMQLSNFTTPAKTDGTEAENYPAYASYYWYMNAKNKLDASDTSGYFGAGRENTGKMIDIWNKNGGNGDYSGATQHKQDVWKHIQTKYNEGWFIPSRAEWSAFANELGITTSLVASNHGLSVFYWSSTQATAVDAWDARFLDGGMGRDNLDHRSCVRLATTF